MVEGKTLMWPVLFLAVAVVFFAGCARKVYPGDGRLVVVEIAPELDACPLLGSTVGEAVRQGIAMWDEAGARLRTVDKLQPEEQNEAEHAPRLPVHGTCPSAQYDPTAEWGEYENTSGEIVLHNWLPDTRWIVATSLVAHEAGHAIGLDHVPDPTAIMHADAAERADLSDADLREHAMVWP